VIITGGGRKLVGNHDSVDSRMYIEYVSSDETFLNG
jgi:hypothetical protein